MISTKIKKIFALVVMAIMLSIGSLPISNPLHPKTAFAEDEDDEKDDDKKQATVKVIDTNPANNITQKTEYVTVYKNLSDAVSTTTDTITRHDSDGDGLYDDEDPHPTINEYFIVKDDNLNGIDDRYESQA